MSDVLVRVSMPDEGFPRHRTISTAWSPSRLERFLERRRAKPNFPLELSLAENLVEVLRRANGFVPSAAGSILLDDPSDKKDDRRQNNLTFIAAFGDKSACLVGQTIPADQGIAGRVYLTGEAYSTPYAPSDRFFYRGDGRADPLPDRVAGRHPDPHRAGGLRRPRADQPPATPRLQPGRTATCWRSSPATSRSRSRTCSTAARRRRSPSATT